MVLLGGALALAACGTGSDGQASNSVTPSVTVGSEVRISLAAACPRVQAALDGNLSGEDERWGTLGAQLSELADESDAEAAPLIRRVAIASTALDGSTNYLDDERAWLDEMEALTEACRAAGTPLA